METYARQLRMTWPLDKVVDSSLFEPPVGYSLREGAPADLPRYLSLMSIVGLGTWDEEGIASTFRDLVPHSWFVVVHDATDELVATSMTLFRPLAESSAHSLEVGWIVAHPEHSGMRLGQVVVAATLSQAISAGQGLVYLQTDDFRLPAIKTYLALGFLPSLWADDMAQRWRTICELLQIPYEPTLWIQEHD